jgi:hypothetical protein
MASSSKAGRSKAGLAAWWVSLLALKALVGAWVVHRGFSHVSDDDYARVVIAERFAHAPSLDPSGTSWLPFPFWVHGAAMLGLGRSLAVAAVLSWGLGLASVLVGYAGLRLADVPRAPAWVATLLVGTSAWNAWLGVATVPEAWAGALAFFGAMTLVTGRGLELGAAALAVACLSRYEAWPVAAVFAAVCAVRAARAGPNERTRAGVAFALAVLGPCMWMAWNAHAHGSALHFLARVTAFHRTHATPTPFADRVLSYPREVVTGAPEIAVLGLFGPLGGWAVFTRWRLPLLAGAALLAFLVYGELHDGAPTHHAARALVVVWWLLAGYGTEGAHAWLRRHAWGRPKREAWVVALGVALGVGLVGMRDERMHRDYPGGGEEEDRSVQVARGLAFRAEGVAGITVVPCEYEHFALMAAYGAPERVEVGEATHEAVTVGCPEVGIVAPGVRP